MVEDSKKPTACQFGVRITSSVQGRSGEEKLFPSKGNIVIGRSKNCQIVLSDPSVSRQHAKLELVSNGLKIVDMETNNGVWVDKERVNEKLLFAGDQFRIGMTTFTVFSVEDKSSVTREDFEKDESVFDETVFMPVSSDIYPDHKWFEEEGELTVIKAHQPFLIDDPDVVWYVVSGEVDLFTVALHKGKHTGTRSHFLRIGQGQCFFGFDFARYNLGSGFLAVGKQETKVRKIRVSHLRALSQFSSKGTFVAKIIDAWVSGLANSLVQGLSIPDIPDETVFKKGRQSILKSKEKSKSADGVVWVKVNSGAVLFNDMVAPSFDVTEGGIFPITESSWIEPIFPIDNDSEEVVFEPYSTENKLTSLELWQGLDVFHRVLCECEFLNKKLDAVDEFIRLEHKAHHAQTAKDAAYGAIGSVLSPEGFRPKEFLALGSTEPILSACELVGNALGMKVKQHPATDEQLTYEDQVEAIASASGFRIRLVALRGDWWKKDQGPLLGQKAETNSPVAILPTGTGSYEVVDPKTGSRIAVNEKLASTISSFAYTFYRPFPDGQIEVMDILRFGAKGLGVDFKLLVIMGVTVGFLGTLTPYITGKIFDSAIPQADRGMIWGFGFALFGSAFATGIFRLVQGIATLRVQGKMEYGIQAALWDRLMNLPANFFRGYSAGDLADRAAGVDAIQNLISGAGVAAILGSFSGLFYVFLMFTYNVRLAVLAIILTFTFVGVTMFANYLQLRHQREEIKIKGRITGLVFNLITGVTKLRIAGAEHHAFRVWAQRFAEQRKISFNIGRIQNFATVFSDIFPIISSMAIFFVMVRAQAEAFETGQTILTTGDFIAFNAAYGFFLTAMSALGEASLSLLRVVPIYERLSPILTTPAEVDANKFYPGKLSGDIELSHIHFRYQEDGPWIIKDLSLSIKPGEFVAFVGGSGCGKSTLMRLMLGFEQPTTGTIYYDGQDLSALDLRMLRQQLGVVLQVSRVLPAEIYRNIVGVSSRPMDEAWQAAEAAGLAEDIKNMPMGMHTYVSEGGGTLSGGQRQRLLIARAVVNKPKIIFLDEATSALDNKTQAVVTESMNNMQATRIVIAHRLSTIIDADKICYLDAGRIVEEGTYQELMDRNGLFADLAKRQMA